MTSIFSISIWRTLHQGGHSMGVSEVCTYGGHLSKRTVVPAVYILEKVMTWDWTTAGTNPSVRFGRRHFWSTHVNQKSSISLLICLEATRLVFLSVVSVIETICWKCGLNHTPRLQKGYFRLTCRVAQVDVTRDDSQRRFLAQHCCDIVATLFRIVTTLFQHCNSMHCIPV